MSRGRNPGGGTCSFASAKLRTSYIWSNCRRKDACCAEAPFGEMPGALAEPCVGARVSSTGAVPGRGTERAAHAQLSMSDRAMVERNVRGTGATRCELIGIDADDG